MASTAARLRAVFEFNMGEGVLKPSLYSFNITSIKPKHWLDLGSGVWVCYIAPQEAVFSNFYPAPPDDVRLLRGMVERRWFVKPVLRRVMPATYFYGVACSVEDLGFSYRPHVDASWSISPNIILDEGFAEVKINLQFLKEGGLNAIIGPIPKETLEAAYQIVETYPKALTRSWRARRFGELSFCKFMIDNFTGEKVLSLSLWVEVFKKGKLTIAGFLELKVKAEEFPYKILVEDRDGCRIEGIDERMRIIYRLPDLTLHLGKHPL